MKIQVKSLQKGSESDQYVVQNLTWSEVYLRSTLSNNFLQKVPILVPLTTTWPEVFITTMTKFLFNYHDTLEETLTNTKSLKLKRYPGENITNCCTEILVDAERLDISRAFNPYHLGYITCIFEDTSDSRLSLWVIQNNKGVMNFIIKLCVCNMDIISPKELIRY